MHVRPNVVTSTLQYGLCGIQNVAFWYNISRITILLIFQRFTVLHWTLFFQCSRIYGKNLFVTFLHCKSITQKSDTECAPVFKSI